MSVAIEKKIKMLNDKHLPTVLRILNRYSYIFTKFREATKEEDTQQGFDAVFSFPDVKIPVRIRNYSAVKFLDFTIRSQTTYTDTEIDKLKKGFGDYYFYAWETQNGLSIGRYMIINLNKFRNTGLINYPSSKNVDNGDGTKFNVYCMDKLIKNNIVVIYENLQTDK